MAVPAKMLKKIVTNLKALEASEEAQKYLVPFEMVMETTEATAPKAVSKPLYTFDNNPNVKEKMSAELKSLLADLILTLRECFDYQNVTVPPSVEVFAIPMLARGYLCGRLMYRPKGELVGVDYVNTKHGLLLIV